MKFHVYDPGYGGNGIIAVVDTLEEAIVIANQTIKDNWYPGLGDEWALEVVDISVFQAPVDCEEPIEDGVLVARAVETNRIDRPDDLDENNYSETLGDEWAYGSYDYVCDYEVKSL